MQYIDFNGHHYGIYVTYVDGFVKLILTENKKRVCDLTSYSGYTRPTTFDSGCVFVNVTKLPFAEELMSALNCEKAGRQYTNNRKELLVEYDVSSLIKFNNREMKRNQMKKGMVQVCEGRGVSTAIIWYAYHTCNKKEEKFVLVTTEGLRLKMEKEFFVRAIATYNIPVYKSFRKEPF